MQFVIPDLVNSNFCFIITQLKKHLDRD